MKDAAIDARLREVLGKWNHETSPAEIVAMGTPALERLLDSLEGLVGLYMPNATELEGREYENARDAAVAAFAKSDVHAVLDSIERRKWPAVRVAYCGITTVVHSRIVPYLIAAYASKEPADRLRAVSALAIQHDARATATLTAALKDRSSSVRDAAAKALMPPRKRKSLRQARTMKANPLLDPKVVAKLCADLRPILLAEIAKRNVVTEASRGYPGAVSVWLSSPFRTKPAELPAHVIHRKVNDPHYWLAEYSCTKHNHFLACGFGRQGKWR